jgi:hypothetical protein
MLKIYIPRIFRKKFFRQKYSNEMSIDAVFDGDYEYAIIFGKTRVHFTM